MKKPVLLAILDGLGLREEVHGNAVKQAHKPNLDSYFAKYPNTTLRADGERVGLPEGQMGNSEVGHTNIGAGRIVYQSLALINKAIDDKTFFKNEVLLTAMNNAQNNSLHVMGLLSDGGVHSHINHLFALLDLAKEQGIKNVYVHAFLDGRDVDPKSGVDFIAKLQHKLDTLGVGEIASISGRYYAMDRDKRWDRVKLAYNTVVKHESDNTFTDGVEYVKNSYDMQVYDEFVLPGINVNCDGKIKDNDSVVFINFRPDRAIQLSGVITNPAYNPKPEDPIFKPDYRPANLTFVSMMKYSDEVNAQIAFKNIKLNNIFGDVVSAAGKKQLRIAETEKYPHVTFFFDGGVDKEIEGSKQILINSPKVATYDLKPEMSAYEVKDALIEELNKDYLDVVILNFANPDMVGHSGMLEPTMKAIEAVDDCLGQIVEVVLSKDGVCCITADHGNSELVTNDNETPNTAHTVNPVPFIVTDTSVELREGGILADIAPTLLKLMGVEQPEEMTGESIVK